METFFCIQNSHGVRRREDNNLIKNIKIIDIKEYKNAELQKTTKLKYFKEPKASNFPLDLNIGYQDYIHRTSVNGNGCYMMHLIDYLMQNANADANSNCERSKIYTERSVLFRSMLWPYYSRFNMRFPPEIILATNFKGNLYLVSHTDEPELRRGNPRPNDTYSFKFRQYCFSDSPNVDPDTSVPVNEGHQTYFIFNADFGEFNLTYSAEVIGGVIADKEIQDVKDLKELNKCRFIMTKLLGDRFTKTRYKNLDYYLQAYLAKVNEIYLGLKNRGGIVNTPGRRLITHDLPKNQFWKPEVCMNFLYNLLKKIKQEMANIDSPYTVYEFKFEPDKKVINLKRHEGKNKLSFLSDEYIEKLENN